MNNTADCSSELAGTAGTSQNERNGLKQEEKKTPKGDEINLRVRLEELMSSDTPTCRICFRSDSSELLISPCYCKGTINNVHPRCLEHWLEVRNSDSCDVCDFKFEVTKTKRSFLEWFKDPATVNVRKKCVFYLLWVLFSTPFVVLFVINCMQSAYRISMNESKLWDAAALSALGTCVAAAQITLIFIVGRYIFLAIRRWRNYHYAVRVRYQNRSPNNNNDSQQAANQQDTTDTDIIVWSSSSSPMSSHDSSEAYVSDESLPLIPKEKSKSRNYTNNGH